MSKIEYESIRDLKDALEGCDISAEEIFTINKGGNLFLYANKDNEPIFIGEYENDKACEDVCTALGIDSPSIV
jgi:hypothetical protein